MKNFLHIFLWGKEIGQLEWKAASARTVFTYNPSYLREGGFSINPLMAPIDDNALFRSFNSEDERLYQRLPAFIADSLPDDWGNVLFEQWRTEQRIPSGAITPLYKLAFIGQRGMGALEFVPDAKLPPITDRIDIAALTALAQRIFVEREKVVIDSSEMLTKQLLFAVGTSAGGRQPKAIIAINRQTGEIRSGQVAGFDGYDYYIIKFGNKQLCTAELEMTYHQMAVAAGIDMMPCRLIEADGEKHFATLRFDRKNGEKQHLQTLAAMDPDADSYEKLLLVCRRLHLPDATTDEVFRRMVFNYLANNTDDHHKNFSFVMNRNGEWSLSPAYDLTYIFNHGGFQPELSHCLLMRGKYDRWTKDDVNQFAIDNGITYSDKIIRKVADAVMQFRTLAEQNGVSQQWIGRIETTLQEHLREWGFIVEHRDDEWAASDGSLISNVYIEQAYKGNYHIFATINSQQRKFIIRHGTPDYEFIEKAGLQHLSVAQLKILIEHCFIRK